MPASPSALRLLACCLCTVALNAADQAEQARAAITAASTTPHPRLLLSEEVRSSLPDRLAADPWLQSAADHVVAFAEAMLPLEPVHHELEGRRLLSQSRMCLKRVLYLGLAEQVNGDARYGERVRQEVLAAAAFKDWNPKHFLDVGEMTAALALAYDWYHDRWDAETLATLREAIVKKGLKPGLRGGWWVEATNNWNPVCHGGLALGALAIAEDAGDIARQTLERTLRFVPRALHEYAPDGTYPEGVGYFQYGTTYAVLLLAGLESACGSSYGLADAPGFIESATYHVQVTGPYGRYFRYYDTNDDYYEMLPAMHWFAHRTGDTSLLWWERPAFTRFLGDEDDLNPANRGERFTPLVLLWGQPPKGDLDRPEALHWYGHGATPVAMHRSSWTDPAASFVATKGGSADTPHAHMDMGTFAVDMLGLRWAEDLGKQKYHHLEKAGLTLWKSKRGGDRWKVFRYTAPAHNVLVVDDEELLVGPAATIVESVQTGAAGHTVLDLTPVYAFALEKATRGVALRPDGSVLIQDEITADGDQHQVRWGMVTEAAIEITAPDQATLTLDGKEITAHLLAPADAAFTLGDLTPPHDWDAPNSESLLQCLITLPAEASTRIAVQLVPPDAVPATTTEPIADW